MISRYKYIFGLLPSLSMVGCRAVLAGSLGLRSTETQCTDHLPDVAIITRTENEREANW